MILRPLSICLLVVSFTRIYTLAQSSPPSGTAAIPAPVNEAEAAFRDFYSAKITSVKPTSIIVERKIDIVGSHQLKTVAIEASNPKFTLVTNSLSEADKLNGYEFKGTATINADAFRCEITKTEPLASGSTLGQLEGYTVPPGTIRLGIVWRDGFNPFDGKWHSSPGFEADFADVKYSVVKRNSKWIVKAGTSHSSASMYGDTTTGPYFLCPNPKPTTQDAPNPAQLFKEAISSLENQLEASSDSTVIFRFQSIEKNVHVTLTTDTACELHADKLRAAISLEPLTPVEALNGVLFKAKLRMSGDARREISRSITTVMRQPSAARNPRLREGKVDATSPASKTWSSQRTFFDLTATKDQGGWQFDAGYDGVLQTPPNPVRKPILEVTETEKQPEATPAKIGPVTPPERKTEYYPLQTDKAK